jgi:peptidoglycan-N-acetylglucosamine deacetylase
MRILSFDIEAWFHILDLPSIASPTSWEGLPARMEEGVDRILDALAEHDAPATFFILGWVAEHFPHVVRKIDAAGYEIGTHSHEHQLVYQMTPEAFTADLKRSMDAIQAVTGKPVRIYRAPGFSITDDTLWAFPILAEHGIAVDCSLFSAPRNHGGVKKISADVPCRLSVGGVELREFPMNHQTIAGRRIVFSGGGFFRLLPYTVIKGMTERSDYTMTYFHPRDFDAGQPRLEMPLRRRFQAYVGLDGALNKLKAYLGDFEFCDVAQAEAKVDWDAAPRIAA